MTSNQPNPSDIRVYVDHVVSGLILAVFLPWSLVQEELVRRVLLGVIILDIPLQVGTHLWFRQQAADVGALGGFNFSITTIALAGLYAGWLPRLATERRAGMPSNFTSSRPFAVYVTISALSTLVAHDRQLALFEVGLFAQMFFLYVYLASTITTRDEIRFITRLLFVGLFLEALLIFALVPGVNLPLWGVRTRIDEAKSVYEVNRASGTIGSANSAAAYLCIACLIAMGVFFSRSRCALRLIAGVAAALGSVALILTYSRGGWLTAGACSLVLLALLSKTKGALVRLLVVLIVLVACFALFGGRMSDRLSSDDKGSAYSRIPLMRMAERMIADHPVLGVGSNNFGEVMSDYVGSDLRGGFLYTVHNQYLLVWAETGIVGLVSFIWFFVLAVRTGIRCWRQGDPELSSLALGISIGLVAFMLHMFVDIFRGRPLIETACVTTALLSCISQVLGQEARQQQYALRLSSPVS